MGLLDAIDKLLEPITKRIFATSLGKSIKPLSGDELFAKNSPDYNNDPAYADIPGNSFNHSWMENE